MANQELFPLASERGEAIDIKRIILGYVRYWYLFVVGGALGLAGAFCYLRFYAVPQYNVYATLLIKDDKSGQVLSNADALTDISTFKTARNIDNETEVIKSKSLMKRVVEELNLFASYYVEGKVKDHELYGASLPIKVVPNTLDSTAAGHAFTLFLQEGNTFELDDHAGHVSAHRFGQQIHLPFGSFTVVATAPGHLAGKKFIVRFQDIQQVADYYNHAVSVQPINKNASILYLNLTDPIPAKAKDVLNKLMEVYNREAVEDKNLITTNTLKFLDNRLQYLTADLSGVEKVVEKYKSENGLTDLTTQASAYTQEASSYNAQLSERAIQIEVLESIEQYLQKPSNKFSVVPSTLGIKDETLIELLKNFNELQLERVRLLRSVEPGNVLVQNIDGQLTNLRLNILENLRNIKKGLLITSNNLKANSGQFQSRIRKVPSMERELLQINRQQVIKQNIYSYLLQKREETAISLAATASVARVIDPAMGGNYPISPNRQIIYLMSFLLGLGLPLAAIYIGRVLDNKVQTQQDVSNLTATPVLGEIVHNDSKETVVVTPGARTPIAEMFRLIRTNLHFATLGKESVVLLVTSSMSGEGKTFCCINLGASMALTGKRVVLLDLDLRNPQVANTLNLPPGPGITDYLVDGDVALSDIIRTTDTAPGLCLLSSGQLPPNPAELIMSERFAHLLQELKASFDFVILDTPPVGKVADALTLRPLVDLSLYVVRYNYTQKGQLGIINNIYTHQTLTAPMIVLNDAKESNGSHYGYEYGYAPKQAAGKTT